MAVLNKVYKLRNVVVLLVLSCCLLVGARQCLGRDQCSCVFDDDQGLIALNSLANTDLTPRFQDISSDDGNTYSYNPCYPFSEGDCGQAAVCEKSAGKTQNIGDAQTAKFLYKNGVLAVGYTSGLGTLTTTQVILQCDANACQPTIAAGGEKNLNVYQLTLTSVCACANGCNETGPVHCTSAGSKRSSIWSLGAITFITCITRIF